MWKILQRHISSSAHEIECVIHLGLSLVTNSAGCLYTWVWSRLQELARFSTGSSHSLIYSSKSDSCPYAIVLNRDDTRVVIHTSWRWVSVRAGGLVNAELNSLICVLRAMHGKHHHEWTAYAHLCTCHHRVQRAEVAHGLRFDGSGEHGHNHTDYTKHQAFVKLHRHGLLCCSTHSSRSSSSVILLVLDPNRLGGCQEQASQKEAVQR